MTKHTRAPWVWHTSNNWKRLKHESVGLVANVLEPYVCNDGHPDLSVSEADMRLIEAAPDLLQACQTFAEWLRREEVDDKDQPWYGHRDTPESETALQAWYEENSRLCALAQTQARAALAKAGVL